jgi:hypothetical protein
LFFEFKKMNTEAAAVATGILSTSTEDRKDASAVASAAVGVTSPVTAGASGCSTPAISSW